MASMIDATFGEDILSAAKDTAADYKLRNVTYLMGGDASQGGANSDCSHFVHDILSQTGIDLPYVTTHSIGGSPDYREVNQEDAFLGVIVVQGGHMGVYSGTDASGNILGWQMGNHGAANGKWGVGGWFENAADLRFYAPVV